MQIIALNSPRYPKNLAEIDYPPEQLFVEGEILAGDEIAVAIVGTRQMTDYGRKTAELFSSTLAKAGITIISGLARGIDTVAHESALKAGGRTIAVFGCGIDIIYPPENKLLAKKISERGALVSQFVAGTPPIGTNFLARNRVIAGLAKAVVVIEGLKRSGTLSTANHAAELGREVFAVPVPINSPQSQAPLYLIENGASMAISPKVVLEFLLANYITFG